MKKVFKFPIIISALFSVIAGTAMAIAVPAITENNADIIIGNLNTFFIIYPLFKILRIQTSTMKGICQGTFLKTAYRWF